MKQILLIFTLIILAPKSYSTEQAPDVLEYQGSKLDLATGWGHPSPLETYYSENKIRYPFKGRNTGNYRGHIATWEIVNEKLYLKEVYAKNENYTPAELGIKSKVRATKNSSRVFADWFNGVIDANHLDKTKDEWEFLGNHMFYVRNGKVIDKVKLTKSDFRILYNDNAKKNDLDDDSLKKKHAMMTLNHNYISYYFRLYGDDFINVEGQHGRLSSKSGFSPVLAYYNDDHMKWPFNWGNSEKSGAPKGRWLLDNNKVYLTELKINTGTNIYEAEENRIELNKVFKAKQSEQQILAKWLTGVFLVKFGEMVTRQDLADFEEFKVSELLFLRLENGNVVESHKLDPSFNFKEIPYNTPSEVKKIIEDFTN